MSERGIYVEVEFVLTKINFKELGDVIDKVVELGAKAVYTGKIMYLGNAVNYWNILSQQLWDFNVKIFISPGGPPK
ncbi:MAG: hypothetical protein RXR43_16425 [Sulfolobus sp.]